MCMEKKKIIRTNTCAMMVLIMLFCAALTWLIPAGDFAKESVDGVTRVMAGTYREIPRSPQGFWDMCLALTAGFQDVAKIMFMLVFCGGAVEILKKSGTVKDIYTRLEGKNKHHVNMRVLTFFIMLVLSIGGAAGGLYSSTLALVPFSIILATCLGYDIFTGFLFVYMGVYSGFNVGWGNYYTIGIAQQIAGLPKFSGWEVRIIFHIINFIICYYYTIHYMEKIKQEPSYSLNYHEGMELEDLMGPHADDLDQGLASGTKAHVLTIVGLMVAVLVVLTGAGGFKWKYDQISAVFLVFGIYAGLVNGMGVEGTTEVFISGCAQMLKPAFIVGMTESIYVIFTNGNILPTIVHWFMLLMLQVGPVADATIMYFVNLIINLFIPSGPLQAEIVMPVLMPLTKSLGITSQVAVQAFQFGDGFSNCISPTAATLMGSLAMAKVEWARYVRWMVPKLLWQTTLAIVSLTILQAIGWTGM